MFVSGDCGLTRRDVTRRIGSMSQLGGIRLSQLDDGSERGVRVADVDTGALRFVVVLDRGMDIAGAWAYGVPLAWLSPAGEANPCFYNPSGTEWLRTFGGGLVSTCGLTYNGAPCEDEGVKLGIHGRIGASPVSRVSTSEAWVGDDYWLRVCGQTREYTLFGENLLLERCISAKLGSTHLTIDDTVTNEGSDTTPLMLLYHINLGWPVVSPFSTLAIEGSNPVPRDAAAADGLEDWWKLEAPVRGYAEKVYYHTPKPDAEGYVRVRVHNNSLRHRAWPGGITAYVKYAASDGAGGEPGLKGLNRLVQWKQMGEGVYVLGIEPSNCHVEGRAQERQRGTLQFIEPGESRSYRVEIGIEA